MEKIIEGNTPEQNRFINLSDFKWCITCGGEVVFEYHHKTFGISPKLKRTPKSPTQILIS